MSAFIYAETETKRRTENAHKLDYIFSSFGGWISVNTTGNFNYTRIYTTMYIGYNLVIRKPWWIVQQNNSVIILQVHVQDYRLLWDKTQSDYKDHY